ncbi:MAG: T9SS type A sorting domain-containing protein [Fidelibacterota bacterium]|nr:MAG: T9SS type A sorting domain-containing protein [Candidatus Neomarinimicrobiota bacterium]
MKTARSFAAIVLALSCLAATLSASNEEITADYDFKYALNYAFTADIDTLILITSGGVYTTTDTFYMAILEPLTIIAKPGLAEKPIFTHSDPDSNVLEIFRVFNDFTVEGVIFDGGHAQSHGMKYAIRLGHEEEDRDGNLVLAKDGTNITVRNCDFRNIYRDKIISGADGPGHAVYFLRPPDGVSAVIRAGTVRIENCTFRNIGDEAVRMTETEKYQDPATGKFIERVLDSLIVRNCTFKNIDAECIRFYADTDVSTEDAYVLIEHLTIDSSATRVAYIKNNQNAIMRNVLVTNSRLPDTDRAERSDFVIQLQQSGSVVSHIDTLNMIFGLPRENRVECTKGGFVDISTVWGFDPLYVDPLSYDYTLQPASHGYWSAHDGSALGDLLWATNTPTTIPFALTVLGEGRVTLDPPIQGRCYEPGTVVTLSAVPDSGQQFLGWSGDLTGTDSSETVTVNQAVEITATFSGEIPTPVETDKLPKEYGYRLVQNYPNPFNPVTRIAFDLARSSWTTLEVYDLLGKRVATLADKHMAAGSYSVTFDGSHLASGIYFYQLRSGEFVSIQKMVLMK